MPGSLLLAGKRVAVPAVHLAASTPPGAALIHLRDSHSHVSYLVDTGAAISLLPHRSPLSPTGPSLVNASGVFIPAWNFVTKLYISANIFLFTNFFKQMSASPFWAWIFFPLILFNLT